MTAIPYFDWISHHAGRRPQQLAIHDLHTGRKFSYADLDDRIARLTAALAARGIAKGDRIALLAPNCTEYFELQFACGRLGAIMLPLNWRLTVPELEYILGDSSPKLLIHDKGFAAQAAALSNDRIEIDHDRPDGDYERALAEVGAGPAPVPLTHDDIGMVMYTSGTTGHPKGAIITHGMVFWNCVNLGIPALITPETVQLVVLPLFHTGGLNCYVNPVFHAGGCNIIMRAFDPGESLRIIGDTAVGLTHFFGVPSIYQFMGAHPAFANTDFSRLQIAGVGGAPMPVPLLKMWEARGLALVQGYGMTETSPAVLVLDAEDAGRKAGSAGRPVLHGELKIVDDEGNAVKPGEMGELWVKGPNITPGYWNRPEANKTSFTNGWLHTGDAARQDADGFYYIVDRTKDMYISGGENVYPAEVEDTLYQIPQIAEAAVIGQPDGTWGETGLAIVVKKPGADLTETQVIAHCRERLARFKCPSRVLFIDALPRNASGKVHKPTLRASFLEKAG